MNIIEQQYQYLEMVWFGLKCQSYKKKTPSPISAPASRTTSSVIVGDIPLSAA